MKNHIFSKEILILTLLIFSTEFCFSQNCNDLINYRDNKLVSIYDKALQNAITKTTSKIDFEKIKTDLLDETKWVASDWSLFTALIAANLKTTADLTNDLLQFTPQGQIVGLGITNADKIYNVIKVGGDINTLISSGAEQFVAEEITKRAGPVGQAAITAKNLASNVITIAEIPNDHKQLKSDIKNAIENIEKEIAIINASILAADSKLKEINNYKNGIDKYLKEECGKKSYSSTKINTNQITYTSSGGCLWRIHLQDVQSNSTFNRTNMKFETFDIGLIKPMTTSVRCHTTPKHTPVHSQKFSLSSQSVSNGNYIIIFQPHATYLTNISASFTGKFIGDKLQGELTFKAKNWTIKQPIELNISN